MCWMLETLAELKQCTGRNFEQLHRRPLPVEVERHAAGLRGRAGEREQAGRIRRRLHHEGRGLLRDLELLRHLVGGDADRHRAGRDRRIGKERPRHLLDPRAVQAAGHRRHGIAARMIAAQMIAAQMIAAQMIAAQMIVAQMIGSMRVGTAAMRSTASVALLRMRQTSLLLAELPWVKRGTQRVLRDLRMGD